MSAANVELVRNSRISPSRWLKWTTVTIRHTNPCHPTTNRLRSAFRDRHRLSSRPRTSLRSLAARIRFTNRATAARDELASFRTRITHLCPRPATPVRIGFVLHSGDRTGSRPCPHYVPLLASAIRSYPDAIARTTNWLRSAFPVASSYGSEPNPTAPTDELASFRTSSPHLPTEMTNWLRSAAYPGRMNRIDVPASLESVLSSTPDIRRANSASENRLA